MRLKILKRTLVAVLTICVYLHGLNIGFDKGRQCGLAEQIIIGNFKYLGKSGPKCNLKH